ncbi:hypothetical protein B0H17DRAFT_1217555 [Mycena rosella]|uniref:Uncharacterized protein n=1 Tax=Mycena rosella TaxID=1033263 RepID=A0AAD7BVW1_MYCRO|nr:hypothetical protein B0H17DRAFT_1217555 [Mycena rosella]
MEIVNMLQSVDIVLAEPTELLVGVFVAFPFNEVSESSPELSVDLRVNNLLDLVVFLAVDDFDGCRRRFLTTREKIWEVSPPPLPAPAPTAAPRCSLPLQTLPTAPPPMHLVLLGPAPPPAPACSRPLPPAPARSRPPWLAPAARPRRRCCPCALLMASDPAHCISLPRPHAFGTSQPRSPARPLPPALLPPSARCRSTRSASRASSVSSAQHPAHTFGVLSRLPFPPHPAIPAVPAKPN